jgi:hypothetical protein
MKKSAHKFAQRFFAKDEGKVSLIHYVHSVTGSSLRSLSENKGNKNLSLPLKNLAFAHLVRKSRSRVHTAVRHYVPTADVPRDPLSPQVKSFH